MFDLDAFVAEQQHATEVFTFTFGGESYELPPQPDVRTAALFDTGQYDSALRTMLGDVQYARFLAANGHLTREGILELLKRHAMHAGSSLGESSVSSGSSKSTARPSKRTSNTTTVKR